MNKDVELAKTELLALLEVPESDFEWNQAVKFLKSVDYQYGDKGFLSKKQMAKIHELWEKHCQEGQDAPTE